MNDGFGSKGRVQGIGRIGVVGGDVARMQGGIHGAGAGFKGRGRLSGGDGSVHFLGM